MSHFKAVVANQCAPRATHLHIECLAGIPVAMVLDWLFSVQVHVESGLGCGGANMSHMPHTCD